MTGFGSVASSVIAVVECATAFSILIYAGFKGNAAAKKLTR